MTAEKALQIHLEEMDFSDIEANADYHSRLILSIIKPYINKDLQEKNDELIKINLDLIQENVNMSQAKSDAKYYRQQLEDKQIKKNIRNGTK